MSRAPCPPLGDSGLGWAYSFHGNGSSKEVLELAHHRLHLMLLALTIHIGCLYGQTQSQRMMEMYSVSLVGVELGQDEELGSTRQSIIIYSQEGQC